MNDDGETPAAMENMLLNHEFACSALVEQTVLKGFPENGIFVPIRPCRLPGSLDRDAPFWDTGALTETFMSSCSRL